MDTAETAGLEAQKNEAEAQALLKRAKDAITELDKADGKPACPTCGQPLTESHFVQERKRRQAELDDWTNRKATAIKARQESEARIKQLRRACSDVDKRMRDLTEQIQKSAAASTQAADEINRAARDCRKAYAALPEDLRTRISVAPAEDWTSTTWPSNEDFTQLEREAGKRSLAEERVKELDQVCSELRSLTIQAAAMRETLAAHQIEIPEDLPGLRDAHARLEKEQKDTEQRLKDARALLQREQQALKGLATQIKSVDAEIAKLNGACDVEQANQSGYDEAVRHATAQLPTDWSASTDNLTTDSLEGWKTQASELEQRGVRKAYNELIEARSNLATIDERLKELETDINRVPDTARQQPEVFTSQLDQTKADRNRHETARQQAETRRGELQAARRRRLDLEQSLRQSNRQLRHLKLLCEMLGKKRLQLYLVRQTERKIVECANHILERLSAGDLHLQLRGGDADDGADSTDQPRD